MNTSDPARMDAPRDPLHPGHASSQLPAPRGHAAQHPMSAKLSGPGQDSSFNPFDTHHEQGSRLQKPQRGTKPLEALSLCFLPWGMFSLVLYLFTMREEFQPLLWAFIGACAVLSVGFAGIAIKQSKVAPLALAVLCFLALALSIPAGSIIRREYMAEYWRLADGASYRHLDPAVSGSTISDATMLEFQDGTFVDTERSVGFMKGGDRFCVAPVSGPEQSKTPTIWAAGLNCCQSRGKFSCGDVSGPAAVTATSVPDPDGHYGSAVRMAAAIYELESPPPQPFFVLWSLSKDDYFMGLWESAATTVAGASLVYLVTSFGAAVFLAKALPPQVD